MPETEHERVFQSFVDFYGTQRFVPTGEPAGRSVPYIYVEQGVTKIDGRSPEGVEYYEGLTDSQNPLTRFSHYEGRRKKDGTPDARTKAGQEFYALL